MAKKEMTGVERQDGGKMRTRDLIYAGAFGAIYLVLMLLIMMGSGTVPILYLVSPLTVGVVCGTVYEMCVLKVRKFGAALILGVLFAVVACSSYPIAFALAIVAALLAELVIYLGKYKSKRMFLASFVVFNLNMACPFTMFAFERDEFLARSVEFRGQAFADSLNALAPDWAFLAIVGLALLGGIIGALVAGKLIAKHFSQAGIV